MSAAGHRGGKSLAQVLATRVAVDIGTTSLTGLQARTLDNPVPPYVAHPIYETLPLSAGESAAIGSDFQRVGPLYLRPEGDENNEFTDAYGVGWLWVDAHPAQFRHPLEKASWSDVSKHPRPALPQIMQIAEPERSLSVVADAPCPGLLDTCFALRNGWQFLDDVTGDWRIASALLDWSLEVAARSYEHMLEALPVQPDVVVYGDDLGFQGGMYLSDTDFRNFLYPRLKTLVSRIRAKTDAAICLHSCGGVKSILADLADLGVDMMNLDFYAKGMELAEVGRALPKTMVLHGPVDLIALGAAALRGERGAVAKFATDLAAADASIQAPPDNMGERHFAVDCLAGAAAIRALDPDDLKTLRDLGPERTIIDRIIAATKDFQPPAYAGDNPRVATVDSSHPPSGHADRTKQPPISAGNGRAPNTNGACTRRNENGASRKDVSARADVRRSDDEGASRSGAGDPVADDPRHPRG